MTTLGIIIYLIGSFIGYVFIVSITQNTYHKSVETKASKLLIYSTIVAYTMGSWLSVVLFSSLSIVDPWFRKLSLFPLHIKTNLK